jgi:hypothetical protein
MAQGLLIIRVVLAAVAAGLVIAGSVAGAASIAEFGLMAALAAEGMGMAALTHAAARPGSRALRGVAEAMVPVGMAALLPTALAVAVLVVVFAIVAHGVETVRITRGLLPAAARGEPARRALQGAANLLVIGAAAAAMGRLHLPAEMAPAWVAWAAVSLSAAAGLIGLAWGPARPASR